ncbi:tlde1 domain-containing protein [Roseisolibacter sp. H3M3-2]|uniref:tlde1 domain-containing protein n=1 Tax=Roseisolibacter sp. H3M3-2 TaxID=3031323 RepID=UPI0023DA066C|nr:tlde1 domain-containing protein [Roseisolibacter sp. H3M3-2]MDF1506367.1 DUF2778 domain-containing protein [Roseisolibacter sp. H3M3-2]
MWTWSQSTGELRRAGKLISRGYSGNGRGKNNPALQDLRGVGPIPVGIWRMVSVYDSPNVGPFTITLWADDGQLDDRHEATGRSAFRCHGDSIRAPGTASKGCIILPRKIRELMWRSGDRLIEVVA